MTSEAQARAGYLLPAVIEPAGRVCVQFQIPDAIEYRAAVAGAVHALAKWHVWEKDGDKVARRAARAAGLFREILHESYRVLDECPDEDEDEDEDILQDALSALADGILNNQVTGGAAIAAGYLLGVDARVIAETALNVVGITLLGGAVAGAVSVAVGGAVAGVVPVAAGEVVELMIETGASVNFPKAIELIGLAA